MGRVTMIMMTELDLSKCLRGGVVLMVVILERCCGSGSISSIELDASQRGVLAFFFFTLPTNYRHLIRKEVSGY